MMGFLEFGHQGRCSDNIDHCCCFSRHWEKHTDHASGCGSTSDAGLRHPPTCVNGTLVERTNGQAQQGTELVARFWPIPYLHYCVDAGWRGRFPGCFLVPVCRMTGLCIAGRSSGGAGCHGQAESSPLAVNVACRCSGGRRRSV